MIQAWFHIADFLPQIEGNLEIDIKFVFVTILQIATRTSVLAIRFSTEQDRFVKGRRF